MQSQHQPKTVSGSPPTSTAPASAPAEAPSEGAIDEVVISLACADEAGQLLTLQRAAFTSQARIYRDPEMAALTQTLAELVAEMATATTLKATLGHRLVGSVRVHLDGSVVRIFRLVVAPDMQGLGIGSHLLDAAEQHHCPPACSAELFTGHLSAANLAMYARRGYHEQRRQPLREGVVRVHMAKALPPVDREDPARHEVER